MFKSFMFAVYGCLIGVLACKYTEAHQPKQMYRVTCDVKKYGFAWFSEDELFNENNGKAPGLHCFQGAEMVRVDHFGAGIAHEKFEHEGRLEMLPVIQSKEFGK